MNFFFSIVRYILKGNSYGFYTFKSIGENNFIHKSVEIYNSQNITIGTGVSVKKDVWLNCIIDGTNKGEIILNDNCNIGMRTTLSCARKIRIHKNVLIGMNAYISDHEHTYKDIETPILLQGISIGPGIEIEEGCWLGANVIISSDKKIVIGKNSIIGANSVVKQSIPAYSVAVGQPARVIKKYNFQSKKWEKAI